MLITSRHKGSRRGHLTLKLQVVCQRTSSLDGTAARWYTNVSVSIFFRIQRKSCLPVVYREFLLLPIFFHFELYMIENECAKKRETCHFLNINGLKICFADQPSIIQLDGNIRSACSPYPSPVGKG